VEATSLAYVDPYHAEPNAMLGCEVSQPDASADAAFAELVGTSGALREVIRMIETVAGGDSTALVWARQERGRSSLLARSTAAVRARIDRSSNSTVRPFPAVCWKARSSDTNGAPSPARSRRGSVASSWLIRAHSSWMRSVIFRWSCSPSCCAYCRSVNSNAWAAYERRK